VLVLHGGREEPLRFALVHADTLRLLDADGSGRESRSPVLVRQEHFEVFEPRLPMGGMFMYLADAGLFRECLTGRRFPVAQEADNAALESAYLQARSELGAELLVTVEGRIALRPPMEGDGMREFLIVERFVNVWPGQTCAATAPE
jgi:copper homeostasis protein (lipoprotein)